MSLAVIAVDWTSRVMSVPSKFRGVHAQKALMRPTEPWYANQG